MNQAANIITAALAGMAVADSHIPEWRMPELPSTDWKHSDERLAKAEEKRKRKQEKRIAK